MPRRSRRPKVTQEEAVAAAHRWVDRDRPRTVCYPARAVQTETGWVLIEEEAGGAYLVDFATYGMVTIYIPQERIWARGPIIDVAMEWTYGRLSFRSLRRLAEIGGQVEWNGKTIPREEALSVAGMGRWIASLWRMHPRKFRCYL